MKAKDYYEKYHAELISEDEHIQLIAARNLVYDLGCEVETIAKQRHTVSKSSVISILKEQNQKWNAICTIFYKNKELCPLQENGFKNYWREKMPELKGEL